MTFSDDEIIKAYISSVCPLRTGQIPDDIRDALCKLFQRIISQSYKDVRGLEIFPIDSLDAHTFAFPYKDRYYLAYDVNHERTNRRLNDVFLGFGRDRSALRELLYLCAGKLALSNKIHEAYAISKLRAQLSEGNRVLSTLSKEDPIYLIQTEFILAHEARHFLRFTNPADIDYFNEFVTPFAIMSWLKFGDDKQRAPGLYDDWEKNKTSWGTGQLRQRICDELEIEASFIEDLTSDLMAIMDIRSLYSKEPRSHHVALSSSILLSLKHQFTLDHLDMLIEWLRDGLPNEHYEKSKEGSEIRYGCAREYLESSARFENEIPGFFDSLDEMEARYDEVFGDALDDDLLVILDAIHKRDRVPLKYPMIGNIVDDMAKLDESDLVAYLEAAVEV